MCGVIGYHADSSEPEAAVAFTRLFRESCVRGLHAFGLAWVCADGGIGTVRTFASAEVEAAFHPGGTMVAHARYSTSGDWRVLENNQPVVAAGRALAFNGCIHMGTKAEFQRAFGVSCETDNDGEVFLRRLEAGDDAGDFVTRIRGSFAGVWLEGGRLHAVRNERRPLWECVAYGARWFASTRNIFARAGFPEATLVQAGVVVRCG